MDALVDTLCNVAQAHLGERSFDAQGETIVLRAFRKLLKSPALVEKQKNVLRKKRRAILKAVFFRLREKGETPVTTETKLYIEHLKSSMAEHHGYNESHYLAALTSCLAEQESVGTLLRQAGVASSSQSDVSLFFHKLLLIKVLISSDKSCRVNEAALKGLLYELKDHFEDVKLQEVEGCLKCFTVANGIPGCGSTAAMVIVSRMYGIFALHVLHMYGGAVAISKLLSLTTGDAEKTIVALEEMARSSLPVPQEEVTQLIINALRCIERTVRLRTLTRRSEAGLLYILSAISNEELRRLWISHYPISQALLNHVHAFCSEGGDDEFNQSLRAVLAGVKMKDAAKNISIESAGKLTSRTAPVWSVEKRLEQNKPMSIPAEKVDGDDFMIDSGADETIRARLDQLHKETFASTPHAEEERSDSDSESLDASDSEK